VMARDERKTMQVRMQKSTHGPPETKETEALLAVS